MVLWFNNYLIKNYLPPNKARAARLKKGLDAGFMFTEHEMHKTISNKESTVLFAAQLLPPVQKELIRDHLWGDILCELYGHYMADCFDNHVLATSN